MTGPCTLQTRRHHIEWMLLGTVLLIFGSLIGYWLYVDRNRVEALEQDRLQTQARVIDENLGRQLEGASNALAGVRDEFPMPVSKSAAQAASRHLKALSDAMPGVRTMLLVNAEGTVLAANRDELIGLNFSKREYFTIPRERPDPAMLYVSPPFTTTAGVFSINVVRVVTGSGGEFAGIVSATLDPEYFNVVLRSVIYAPDMWTSVAHGDGIGFLYVPPNDRAAGLDLAMPGSYFSRHRQSGQSATVLTGTVDTTDEERMMAVRTIERADLRIDKPLVVTVGRDVAAIYLPWRRQLLAYGVFYAVSAAAAILGLYLFQRRQQTLDRLAAAQATERRESAERLELALGGADLGLWDWHVPSGKVILNQRWCAMLGYTLEEIEPNVSSWQKQVQVHPDDLPVIHATLDPHLKGETPVYESEHRLRHKDGHWIWILDRGKVMERDAAGLPVRMVGTHMDVTNRKRNEEKLHQNAAELKNAYRRLAQAQEAERRALTKELHDQVGQNLSALNLNLHYIDRELSGAGHESLKERLADCLVVLDETVTRVRSVMGNLRPPMLDEFGLFATLRWWAHETTQRSGIPCTLVGEDLAQPLPTEMESALLRIAQEALMNAAKYSNASQIRIALTATPQQVRMEIADDGVGFDATVRNAIDNTPTWGLTTMRERADALGGTAVVISAPGAGTRVVVKIPGA